MVASARSHTHMRITVFVLSRSPRTTRSSSVFFGIASRRQFNWLSTQAPLAVTFSSHLSWWQSDCRANLLLLVVVVSPRMIRVQLKQWRVFHELWRRLATATSLLT